MPATSIAVAIFTFQLISSHYSLATMAIDQQSMHDRPSKYTLLDSLEKTTDSGVDNGSLWNSRPSKPWQTASFGSAEDLSRQSDSYMIVSHAPTEPKPLPKNTKGIMKWSRVILLLLRICSWLGAGGLLACIICIRTVGTPMDWFMRIPVRWHKDSDIQANDHSLQ